MATLIDGLEAAFLDFGGVPRFDQMKAVITRDLRLEGGALVRNAEFLRFAHYLELHAARLPSVSRADERLEEDLERMEIERNRLVMRA